MRPGRLIALIVFGFCFCHTTISSCITAVMQKFMRPLTPPLMAEIANDTQRPPFATEFNLIGIVRAVYTLDVIEKYSPEIIKDIMATSGALDLCAELDIKFDWDSMHEGKKGFTRVYRVEVKGKKYKVRIFDAQEATYQEEENVMREIAYPDPADPKIIFQIIPDAKPEKIEPEEVRPAA